MDENLIMDALNQRVCQVEKEILALKEIIKGNTNDQREICSIEPIQNKIFSLSKETPTNLEKANVTEHISADWIQEVKSKAGDWTGAPLVVLSLFDGIGGIWVALSLLGIPFVGYSSEINRYSVQVLEARFPSVRAVGDVRSLQRDDIKDQVDLVVGGFPCQDLSCIGRMAGLHGERSRLFFELLRLLKLFKPKWFLLENVASMYWVEQDEISKHMRCIPIEINSQELTPGKRRRLYWTNVPHPKELPKVRDHESNTLQSVLEDATALEQKLGCILGRNCVGSHTQLQLVYENESNRFRYINVTEVEKVMGYPAGYTDIQFKGLAEKNQGLHTEKNPGKETVEQAIRWRLLGNSFSVKVIAYLLSTILDPAMRSNKVSLVDIPGNVSEHECSVMDVGEVWALYSTQRRPNWYAVIVNRSGDRFSPLKNGKKEPLNIQLRFLDLTNEYLTEEVDRWSPKLGAGLYSLSDTIENQASWGAFSHRVTGVLKFNNKYFVYPNPGEIWAMYNHRKRHISWFVYVDDVTFNPIALEHAEVGKEGFKITCLLLQQTTQHDVFRLTTKKMEFENLLGFSFMVPYHIINQESNFKFEFSCKAHKCPKDKEVKQKHVKRRPKEHEENNEEEETIRINMDGTYIDVEENRNT